MPRKKPDGKPAFRRASYAREAVSRSTASELCLDLWCRTGAPSSYTAVDGGHDVTLPAEILLALVEAARPKATTRPKATRPRRSAPGVAPAPAPDADDADEDTD